MQNNNDVCISVVTATWNSIDTIESCLNSFDSQEWKNKEHIVIDGGSTDGTIEILMKNKDKISRFISEPDSGIYDALNKGIKLASGQVIGFLHSDDLFYDAEALSNIGRAFSDPSVCAVYGDLLYVNKYNTSLVVRNWKSSDFNRRKLLTGWMPPHPTLYVRKDWYTKIGGFDSSYKVSADYLSIIKLFSEKNFKSKYVPKFLVKMRVGGASNKSIKNILLKSKEDYFALKIFEFGVFFRLIALLGKNLSKIPQFFSKNN